MEFVGAFKSYKFLQFSSGGRRDRGSIVCHDVEAGAGAHTTPVYFHIMPRIRIHGALLPHHHTSS